MEHFWPIGWWNEHLYYKINFKRIGHGISRKLDHCTDKPEKREALWSFETDLSSDYANWRKWFQFSTKMSLHL